MKYLDILDKECQKVILKTIMSEKRLAKKQIVKYIIYSKAIKFSKFTYKSKVINQTLLGI